jgi:hypothetical protein
MSVDVATGRAIIEFTNTVLTPNKTYKTWFDSDTVVNVPISTADATNPRKDIIIAKIDGSVAPNAGAANNCAITVIAGTPAGSPVAPSVPSGAILLATVNVAAGATSIVNANITDGRTYVQVGASVLADIARESKITAIHNNSPFAATATGSSNAYALTLTTNITAYAANQLFFFRANHDNTGVATLNVNGLGAKTIKKVDGAVDLIAGDIKNGQFVAVLYDGTNFQMISPPGAAVTVDDDNLVIRSTEIAGGTTNNSEYDLTSATLNSSNLAAGKMLTMHAHFRRRNDNSSTHTIRVKIGNTTICSATFPTTSVTITGWIEVMISIRSTGGSGTVFGVMKITCNDSTYNRYATSDNSTPGVPVTVDLTGNPAFKITGQETAFSALTEMRHYQGIASLRAA